MDTVRAMTADNRDIAATAGRHTRLPVWLFAACVVFWAALAIAPLDRFDWLLENLLVFATAPFLIRAYRRRPLSDLSYVLIVLFYCLHTVGSHYTYSEVPIGYWVRDLLGLARNHYDRVVHFTFGLLLCYPLQEVIARSMRPRGNWALAIAVMVVCTCSLAYETMEWIVAVIVDPDAGLAFLGTQGDVFDAQKDSALAASGAIITASITFYGRKRRALAV
jgi:putative membrane protein